MWIYSELDLYTRCEENSLLRPARVILVYNGIPLNVLPCEMYLIDGLTSSLPSQWSVSRSSVQSTIF